MNRMINIVFVLMCVVALFTISGCGTKTPSQVVVATYMAANNGKYSEAEEYLSVNVANLAALSGGMKSNCDRATRNGTIQKVEVLKEDIRGEVATVFFKVLFKEGKIKKDSETLVKENGLWKIKS